MKKLLFAIIIFFFLTNFFLVNAKMISPHYEIEEDAISVEGMGQGIDVYRTESAQVNAGENIFAQVRVISSETSLWKIILGGFAGMFLIISFFIWFKGVFKLERKRPIIKTEVDK